MMSHSSAPAGEQTLAVVGNPNTGKTTLFNALTGLNQTIANYPGTTIEHKAGRLAGAGGVRLVDLPGAYSLAAQSEDEKLTSEMLFGHSTAEPRIDAILCVIDATSLRRNLFLLSQLMELERPIVVALTMVDILKRRGIVLDAAAISKVLGLPVISVHVRRGQGVKELSEVLRNIQNVAPAKAVVTLPQPLQAALDRLETRLAANPLWPTRSNRPGFQKPISGQSTGHPNGRPNPPRAELLHWLLGRANQNNSINDEFFKFITAERVALAGAEKAWAAEAAARFEWADRAMAQIRSAEEAPGEGKSDWADKVLTHPVAGFIVFAFVAAVVFQAIYSWAGPLMDAVDSGVSWLGVWVGALLPQGAFSSLLVDGVIGGVGSVAVFFPQIFILFCFIAILEDCGYLARIAYLLDGYFRKLGLSGKSFLPLISSFACAVPGIMAARTIEGRRERLLTVLLAPLMSCSARLPVYILMIMTFIPERIILGGWLGVRALLLVAMYMVGVAAAILVALLLKRILPRKGAAAFLLELPSYRLPSVRTVLLRGALASKDFLKNAGTVILACSVLIWALGYFPRPAAIAEEYAAKRAEIMAAASPEASAEKAEALAQLADGESGAYLRQSYLGRIGHAIEPVVRPLGWDWRIGMAVAASFPAREVIVATLGTIFNLSDADESSMELRSRLRSATWPDGRPLITAPVALSIMVFFALCCQCVSTLAVIRKETGSWMWPAVSFVYMTLMAYMAAWTTYVVSAHFLV